MMTALTVLLCCQLAGEDVLRRRAVRALPAGPGDRGAGGAAVPKPRAGPRSAGADARRPDGRVRHRNPERRAAGALAGGERRDRQVDRAKAATTPIAIAIPEQVGGPPSVTPALVIATRHLRAGDRHPPPRS